MQRALTGLVIGLLASDVLADTDTIEELIVTATRRPAVSSEISYAIDAVGGEAVRPLITDSLRDAVGVFVQQTTPGQGAAIIRGLKGSAVLHLVDGFRLNNAIFRDAPTQYMALVPPAGVERIEVVRGTPASLYGSDAVGGVVQVVMRRPEFEAAGRSGFVELAVDSAELSRNLEAGYEAGNETLAAGLYLNHFSSGNRRIGGGQRVGPTGYEANGLRGVLNWTPAERHRAVLDVQYQHQPSTPRFDELNAGFGQLAPDSDEFFFEPNSRLFVLGEYRLVMDDIDWTLNLGHQAIDDDRRSRASGSSERRFEANSSRLTGLSSRWSGDAGSVSWVAGVDFYSDEVTSSGRSVDTVSGDVAFTEPRFPDGSTARQLAMFGNASWRLNERTLFSGGLRYSSDEVELAPTSLTAATTLTVDNPSGDLGLIVDLDERWQWTANAGFGFRSPNVFDAGTLGNRPGNRFNIPNAALDSEQAIQFDTGLRYRSSRLSAELVVYRLDYDDRITSVSTGEQTSDGRDIVQSVNAAGTDIHGLEAGFDLDITDRLRLDGLLNYTRAEQTVGGIEEPGDRIPPLNGRLRLEFAASDEWLWRAQLAFADAQERLSARDRSDNRIDPDGTPGWVTLDAGVTYSSRQNWTLTIAAHNMFDQRYRFHGSGLDAPGRGVSLSFAATWGE